MTTKNFLMAALVATCVFQLAVIIHLMHKPEAVHNPIPYYCQSVQAMEQFQEDHPTLGLVCNNL